MIDGKGYSALYKFRAYYPGANDDQKIVWPWVSSTLSREFVYTINPLVYTSNTA